MFISHCLYILLKTDLFDLTVTVGHSAYSYTNTIILETRSCFFVRATKSPIRKRHSHVIKMVTRKIVRYNMYNHYNNYFIYINIRIRNEKIITNKLHSQSTASLFLRRSDCCSCYYYHITISAQRQLY